jgi:hypothetical protein
MARGGLPGRGVGFDADMDPSQSYSIPYGIPGYHPGMMAGYQMGYQTPYSYGNMFMGGYPYGFAQQYHPGYQMQPGAASFDPRQHPMHYMAQAARGIPSPAQR